MGCGMKTPALFTSTSRPPSASMAWPTIARTASGSARSACTVACPLPGSSASTAAASAAEWPW
jgi:hypothetical protein